MTNEAPYFAQHTTDPTPSRPHGDRWAGRFASLAEAQAALDAAASDDDCRQQIVLEANGKHWVRVGRGDWLGPLSD